MPSAEIIAIGSELLLGETLDTNTQYLLQNFRTLGIDIFRTQIIGDNIDRIVALIREARERADIVITTGGLGPTIDDPTREAVSRACGCEQVFSPALWDEILAYFQKMGRTPTLNNKRQAYIPAVGEAISNPVGTAPAFCVRGEGKLLVSLPGVPHEMKYLFENSVIPLIRETFHSSGVIVMRNLHSYGLGESAIDELVGDLEEYANPTLGLCAKYGQIDLRITAKAETASEAEQMADRFEAELREKLGDAIFGKDEETLSGIVDALLKEKGKQVRVLEVNGGGKLQKAFSPEVIRSGEKIMEEAPEPIIQKFLNENEEDTVSAAISMQPEGNGFIRVDVFIRSGSETAHTSRSYNELTFDERFWVNFTLNSVRKAIL